MMQLASYIPSLLSGLFVTLILTVCATACGLSLAIGMLMCRYFNIIILKQLVEAVVFFICGTPLLVQIFLLYYGASQFEFIRHSIFWIGLREPMICAIIALSLNTACYTYNLLLGAIQSVPRNEIMACDAMAMSKWLSFRHIILPRAFRIALPAYSNEVVIILKSTSLASTITLLDLMGMTQQLIAETYDTVTLYVIAGCLYLALNAMITGLFKLAIRGQHIPQT